LRGLSHYQAAAVTQRTTIRSTAGATEQRSGPLNESDQAALSVRK
jgi:hypothetical protein